MKTQAQLVSKGAVWVPDVTTEPASSGYVATALLRIHTRRTPAHLKIVKLSAEDVRIAHEGLARFDQEVSRQDQPAWSLHVPRDPEFNEVDDGVIRKSALDKKMYLHYRPDLEKLLAARGIELSEWQRNWFAACGNIWRAGSDMMDELARKMDMVRPGFNFAKRVEEARHLHCVRVLKYEPRAGVIARPHTDRAAITFHIAESADGFYSIDGWQRPIHKTPETPFTLCFSGQQLESITSGVAPSLWHGVHATTDESARWAIVFFGKMKKDGSMY